jgi:hypothetical protein
MMRIYYIGKYIISLLYNVKKKVDGDAGPNALKRRISRLGDVYIQSREVESCVLLCCELTTTPLIWPDASSR